MRTAGVERADLVRALIERAVEVSELVRDLAEKTTGVPAPLPPAPPSP